ncbi:hypothetical protein P7C73_g5379, partial [Tremellales sp. Uapishka_1]
MHQPKARQSRSSLASAGEIDAALGGVSHPTSDGYECADPSEWDDKSQDSDVSAVSIADIHAVLTEMPSFFASSHTLISASLTSPAPSFHSKLRVWTPMAAFKHLQDDFPMKSRRQRLSFNGQALPPSPSTLPRANLDWYDAPAEKVHRREEQIEFAILKQKKATREKVMPTLYQEQAPFLPRQAYPVQRQAPTKFAPPTFPSYPPEPFLHFQGPTGSAYPSLPDHYTPNAYDNGFLAFDQSVPGHPIGYRAPVLHPRLVQLSEPPITPHDTYRYPASHAEHTYVAPPADVHLKEENHLALAQWYGEQVIKVLVSPGYFRAGTGGSADSEWGMAGREKEGWVRVNRNPPEYKSPWGRMGMTSTPVYADRPARQRRLEREVRDPFGVSWSGDMSASTSLLFFIKDMIARMTISPTAIVLAVWYLRGLGLHEGDGSKGQELRAFLREIKGQEQAGVEKRVAMLGLLLAGKWLDDNSFLTKSWTEVTMISTKHVNRLETAALKDLYHSLHVTDHQWAAHVGSMYMELVPRYQQSMAPGQYLVPLFSEMLDEAYPKPPSSLNLESRRTSAADQAINTDWGTFSRSYQIDQNVSSSSPLYRHLSDIGPATDSEARRWLADIEAERTVSALVDDGEIEMEDDEDDDLEYDGAKRWLPPKINLRRSGSNSSGLSSDTSMSVGDRFRAAVPMAKTQSVPAPKHANYAAQQAYAPSSRYQQPTATAFPTTHTNGITYLEPGIFVDSRPPPAFFASFHHKVPQDSRGWGGSPGQW